MRQHLMPKEPELLMIRCSKFVADTFLNAVPLLTGSNGLAIFNHRTEILIWSTDGQKLKCAKLIDWT
jgi:hypothetical protein